MLTLARLPHCLRASAALREMELEVEQGADLMMVKPGLAYLDVLPVVKTTFGLPTAVYCVSGEYAMIEAADRNGWLEEKAIVMEMMTTFKRAGAGVARWLGGAK